MFSYVSLPLGPLCCLPMGQRQVPRRGNDIIPWSPVVEDVRNAESRCTEVVAKNGARRFCARRFGLSGFDSSMKFTLVRESKRVIPALSKFPTRQGIFRAPAHLQPARTILHERVAAGRGRTGEVRYHRGWLTKQYVASEALGGMHSSVLPFIRRQDDANISSFFESRVASCAAHPRRTAMRRMSADSKRATGVVCQNLIPIAATRSCFNIRAGLSRR